MDREVVELRKGGAKWIDNNDKKHQENYDGDKGVGKGVGIILYEAYSLNGHISTASTDINFPAVYVK